MKLACLIILATCLTMQISCIEDCCDSAPDLNTYPSIRVIDRIGHDRLDTNRLGHYVHDSIQLEFTVDSSTFNYAPVITESKSFSGNSVYTIYTEKTLGIKRAARRIGIEQLIIHWNSDKSDTLHWNVIASTHRQSQFELDSLKLNGELQENNYRVTILH